MVMSTTEAGHRYGIHPETLRRWIDAGRLPAVKVGRTYVLEAKDVEAALAERPKRTGRPRKESKS